MKVHQLLLLIALFAVFNIEAKKKKKKKAAAIASATVFDSDSERRPTALGDHSQPGDHGNHGDHQNHHAHCDSNESDSDSDSKSKLSPKDAKLANIFKKMSDPSLGKVINLDSTFGGSKCNCVCKNMDEL